MNPGLRLCQHVNKDENVSVSARRWPAEEKTIQLEGSTATAAHPGTSGLSACLGGYFWNAFDFTDYIN